MKCLSLWQPWASLLVHGRKRVETRSWPIRHRGPLLIHAAKKWDAELERMSKTEPFKSALVASGSHPDFLSLPKGSVIGRVDVVECFPTERVSNTGAGEGVMEPHPGWLRVGQSEGAFGDYSPCRFAFVCSNPVAFAEPIPFRGMQGMFDVPDELIASSRPAAGGGRGG